MVQGQVGWGTQFLLQSNPCSRPGMIPLNPSWMSAEKADGLGWRKAAPETRMKESTSSGGDDWTGKGWPIPLGRSREAGHRRKVNEAGHALELLQCLISPGSAAALMSGEQSDSDATVLSGVGKFIWVCGGGSDKIGVFCRMPQNERSRNSWLCRAPEAILGSCSRLQTRYNPSWTAGYGGSVTLRGVSSHFYKTLVADAAAYPPTPTHK